MKDMTINGREDRGYRLCLIECLNMCAERYYQRLNGSVELSAASETVHS